jgi:hypothetical protein
MDDIDKREAELLARLEAEREQRLAKKVANGELVEIKLFIVAGSQSEARAQVEEAKADKLAEMRDAGDQREVVFDVTIAVTGVLRPGEAADPAKVPSAPSFLSSEDRPIRPPMAARPAPSAEVVVKDEVREAPAPVVESYVQVQVRRCRDDDDPGEIAEGWFSVDDAGQVMVTNANGKYVGSRAMLEGEDARVVAKQLLREKTPEAEGFNRRLSYPNAGLA